jgi:hypothetical protein
MSNALFGGVIGYSDKPSGSPVERDPDSVEQLLTQVLNQSFEIKDALGTMRHQLLGPWPEPAPTVSEMNKPSGLVPNMKEALYKMIDTHREIREHIAVISKGVR